MALPTLGSQLLVFCSKFKVDNDIDLILDSLRDSGYAAVEGGPTDPTDYKKKLADRGLKFAANHVGLSALDDVKGLVKYLKAVGGADLCNSGLRTWNKPSLEDYKHGIAILNRVGKQLRDEGIRLHYHNHAFEFDKVDGGRNGMDILLEGLDFNEVDLCLDVAWILRGGDDPASYLRKHAAKIGYLHFKDFDGADWCELGRGKVDFASVMKVLPELKGVRWVMAEQDSTKIDPRESARISREYLKKTFNY